MTSSVHWCSACSFLHQVAISNSIFGAWHVSAATVNDSDQERGETGRVENNRQKAPNPGKARASNERKPSQLSCANEPGHPIKVLHIDTHSVFRTPTLAPRSKPPTVVTCLSTLSGPKSKKNMSRSSSLSYELC